ncbi:flavin reductase family protein [Leucobacter sp. wl10]|uniref:flavin reductase family protein n=1 Tax=Leucobacter sp. wl10 TaxID=2304677 RepID=UPI0013C2B4DD|nr:flavin reductase family protein [Leucobacter sp. wl10]
MAVLDISPAHTVHQDPRSFRDALGRYATGVAVVAALTPEGPVGMAVNSFTSVSLDPPLIAFCPMRTSRSWAQMRSIGSFSVSVLRDVHEDAARLLSSKSADKFSAHDWRPGPSGHPVLADALVWFDTVIETVTDGGDHEVVLARVNGWSDPSNDAPLVFFGGQYRSLEAPIG